MPALRDLRKNYGKIYPGHSGSAWALTHPASHSSGFPQWGKELLGYSVSTISRMEASCEPSVGKALVTKLLLKTGDEVTHT